MGQLTIYKRDLKTKKLNKANNESVTISKSEVEMNGTIKIGRDRANDIVINGDPLVSRFHAVIEKINFICQISDNGSTNGTYVNNNPIKTNDKERLDQGDKIQIGNSTIHFI